MEDEVMARNATVELYTLGGVQVVETLHATSLQQNHMDIKNLPSGTYMLVVHSEGKALGKKVIISH